MRVWYFRAFHPRQTCRRRENTRRMVKRERNNGSGGNGDEEHLRASAFLALRRRSFGRTSSKPMPSHHRPCQSRSTIQPDISASQPTNQAVSVHPTKEPTSQQPPRQHDQPIEEPANQLGNRATNQPTSLLTKLQPTQQLPRQPSRAYQSFEVWFDRLAVRVRAAPDASGFTVSSIHIVHRECQ